MRRALLVVRLALLLVALVLCVLALGWGVDTDPYATVCLCAALLLGWWS